MDSQKKSDKFSGNFSIFTITLVALVAVIFHKSTEKGTLSLEYKSQSGIQQIDQNTKSKAFPLDVINEGLKSVYQSKDLNEQKTRLENDRSDRNIDPNQYQDLDRIKGDQRTYGLQVQPRNRPEEIAKQNRAIEMDHNKLDTDINRELAAREDLADYDRAYQQEFIRQFIENARRDGLEVILNDDNTIKEVRKIEN